MSQGGKPIRIAIGDNFWTRALVDGTVRVEKFPVEFHAKVTLPDRLHGVREGKWDGSDGTLTDYLLEMDAGAGVPKVALPIFMLGGFRQRTLLMRRDGVTVKDLRGKKILLPRVLTPGGVYVRGFLAEEFGIARESIEWHTIHGADEDAEWKWLKGRLNKPEGFEAVVAAAEMLDRGEFAAMVHPGGHGFYSLFGGDAMIGGTLKRFPNLHEPLGDPTAIAAWFKKARIYPVVHALQLGRDCLETNPGLAEALVDAFTRAWTASELRLEEKEQELIDRERTLLGFDPYRYGLGEVQRRTIEKLMDYLEADGLLGRRFTIKELFPFAAKAS
jgi:4,5-dihydroxyphthalate decarboxylase